ncbi:response regulator [Pyruvatibacter sp.]|uniref:response regulator n=1 Tax=Pyruvatibacter sp. TaxID=1981328 RepID=UPI003266B7B7
MSMAYSVGSEKNAGGISCLRSAYDDITVMIVDDQRTIRRILRQLLFDAGLTHFLEAHDGQAALARLSDAEIRLPDLVITDIYMEPMDGLELLQKLRLSQDARIRTIPVIVLTGAEDETLLDVTSDMNVTAVLPKPVSSEDLRAAASKAMGISL